MWNISTRCCLPCHATELVAVCYNNINVLMVYMYDVLMECLLQTTSLMYYLYVAVYRPEPLTTCTAGQPVTVTAQSGFLANVITETSEVGSESCPWLLSAQPGQRFNLTVVNFARAPNTGGVNADPDMGGSPRICYQLAVLMENGVRRTLTECEGGSRISRPFLSASHQVQISMMNRKSHDVYFLVKFEGKLILPWHHSLNSNLYFCMHKCV